MDGNTHEISVTCIGGLRESVSVNKEGTVGELRSAILAALGEPKDLAVDICTTLLKINGDSATRGVDGGSISFCMPHTSSRRDAIKEPLPHF